MKRIFFLGCFSLTLSACFSQQEFRDEKDSFYTLTPVEVKAVRAGEFSPFAKTNISAKRLSRLNMGQDLPFLLNQTPSVVVNSDAGNGIGYTGIRIRGTDASRINVTLNGIPFNDSESQGTFFVDLPDFASSTGTVQVQRGVGTSSNGAGAFGANINFSTNEISKDPYIEFNNSAGSFNTWKNTLKMGTGNLKGFTTTLRLSRISSDGFIDRASSRLKSFFISQAYSNLKTSLRLNIFSGKEKTYQAWNGISEDDLRAGNRRVNYSGTEKPGEPYANETDNYTQTHYQFFFDQKIKPTLHVNTGFFLTKGKGYYEQYKANEDYAKYNQPYPINGVDTIFRSDFIRQLWLNNDFYGSVFSLQYKKNNSETTFGGAITHYKGKHYGKLIWAANGLTSQNDWYNLDAFKNDFNIYGKEQLRINDDWHLFLDLQYRHVGYTINGFRYNPHLVIQKKFDFFNPKAGITYSKNDWKVYLSFSVANKEPNRDDFETGATQQPGSERLYDVETGVERSGKQYNWSANLYYMDYKDQLVLTGKINDVGAYTRTNIPESFRAGIELQGNLDIKKWLNVSSNLTLSSNKVKNFIEYIDDYDNGVQKINLYHSTNISFSPGIIGSLTINVRPSKKLEISLPAKYISKQYLDNTQNDNRSLAAFFVQDLRTTYTMKFKKIKEILITGQVNNLFDKKYEPNGYTYSYLYGGEMITENYYFPMAGVNFLLAINLKL